MANADEASRTDGSNDIKEAAAAAARELAAARSEARKAKAAADRKAATADRAAKAASEKKT